MSATGKPGRVRTDPLASSPRSATTMAGVWYASMRRAASMPVMPRGTSESITHSSLPPVHS